MAITFGVWPYTSDSGQVFNLRIETAAGTAVNGAPPGGSAQFPPHRGKVRKVDCKLTAGTGALRKRIPCCSNTNTIWTAANPGTLGIGTGTYTIDGRVGEKRY